MSTLESAEATLRTALAQGPKQPQALIAAIYEEHGKELRQTVRITRRRRDMISCRANVSH